MKKLTFLLSLFIFTTTVFANKTKLPNVKLKNMDKKKVNMTSLSDEGPIVINFWNLACEPCKKEMVELDKMNKKLIETGFKVVSVNIDNTRNMSKVKSFVKSRDYSFIVLSDPKAELFRKLGGKIMPFSIIVDNSGEVVKKHVGYNPGDEKKLEEEVRNLLLLMNKDNFDDFQDSTIKSNNLDTLSIPKTK